MMTCERAFRTVDYEKNDDDEPEDDAEKKANALNFTNQEEFVAKIEGLRNTGLLKYQGS